MQNTPFDIATSIGNKLLEKHAGFFNKFLTRDNTRFTNYTDTERIVKDLGYASKRMYKNYKTMNKDDPLYGC